MEHASRITAGLALAVSTLALLAGCVGSDVDESVRSDAELRVDAVEEWRYDARPVGQSAVVVDGVVLAYTLGADDDLELRALDATDGSEMWSSAVSTGAIGQEVRINPIIVRDDAGEPFVLTVRRPLLGHGQYAHRLQMRDLRTGEIVIESEPMWVNDPHNCRTTNVGVCFWGIGAADDDYVSYRFDPETGTTEPFDDRLPGYDEQVRLGQGLYVVDEGRDEVLILLDDHDVDTQDRDLVEMPQWRTPIDEIFGTGLSIIESLHSAMRDDDSATVLVHVQQVEGSGDDQTVVEGTEQVVAIDLDTGELRWRRDDVDVCGWMTLCTGAAVYTPNDARETGGMGYWDREKGATRLERIDPVTGDEQWSLEVDDLGDAGEADGPDVISVAGYRAISDSGSPLLIDVETGVARGLDSGEVAGCWREVAFEGHEYSNPARDLVEFTSGGVVVSCGASGESEAPLSVAAVRSSATSWGERDEVLFAEHDDGPGADDDLEIDTDEVRWRVLQTSDAIVGYRF